MKALCMVAHPDDCIIFGYPYIYHHSHWSWTVGYLTHTADSERGQECARFWHSRGVDTVFIGLEDHPRDLESQTCLTWDAVQATNTVKELCNNYDIVLSHSPEGDYGHVHHKLVHEAASQHPGLVTFAAPHTGTVTYALPPTAYSLDELPQHREIIASFHPDLHVNSYCEIRS